jgi:hypothetical protein
MTYMTMIIILMMVMIRNELMTMVYGEMIHHRADPSPVRGGQVPLTVWDPPRGRAWAVR